MRIWMVVDLDESLVHGNRGKGGWDLRSISSDSEIDI